MPRLSYFGALLAFAILLSCPVLGQKPAPTNAPPTARVQRVVVRGTGDAMEVEIQTSGAPVAPNTQAITGPDRIVVDFPGALPDAELRALKVNRGALKAVRSGLFFSNPPITRVVLDLTGPQPYQISTMNNVVVVKLGSGKPVSDNLSSVATRTETPHATATPVARLQNATLATAQGAATPRISSAVSEARATLQPAASEPPPPKPAVTVTFENGMPLWSLVSGLWSIVHCLAALPPAPRPALRAGSRRVRTSIVRTTRASLPR
ncbi:MAG: AMIN domain-containing protein, partial [Acidobacteriia bacterium]|nr:AMIN domain-containing protein [Terriglobia bacterium]